MSKQWMAYLLACVAVLAFFDTCFARHISKRQAPAFNRVQVGTVTSHDITEASGLAASRKHPGILYTHNDHGGAAEIYAISASSGHREATYSLKGVTSNDWEDIALGPCSSSGNKIDYCIYVGDFGGGGQGALNNIYRFAEPDNIHSQSINVPIADKLEFSWDQQDCETLMVDPNGNVYIISKVDNAQGTIAQLPQSAWGTNIRVDVSSSAIVNIQSTQKDPVGGDISFDGSEVLIKAKHKIFYWNATGTTDYVALLQTPGTTVNYIDEPQGEAVCWDAAGLGYYTLSEGQDQPRELLKRVKIKNSLNIWDSSALESVKKFYSTFRLEPSSAERYTAKYRH